MASVVTDGVPVVERLTPEERRDMLERSFISFEGGQMKTIFPKKSDRAAVLLDPGKSPKQITVTWEDGGGVEDGIYELSGDQLRICIAPRSKRPRPTSFDIGRQSQDVTLLVLRRYK